MAGSKHIAARDHTLFEEQTAEVIRRLRKSVATLIDSLPLDGHRPIDLSDAAGIDMKLAWRIVRLRGENDVFSAARYVPGAAGMKIFLRAARRAGASKDMVAAADDAFERFAKLVETHAGSRKAFDMMLGGYARDDRARADLEHRRSMFEGGSYVWGVQARIMHRLDVLAPSDDPAYYDMATVRGFVDLRRLRANVPWRIGAGYSIDDTGAAHANFTREPLSLPHDAAAGNGVPLMPEFCSEPLPRCRRVEAPHGVSEYELVEGAVGNTGLLTCVTGELIRRFEPRPPTDLYNEINQLIHMRTPSELVVFDVLVHKDFFDRPAQPQLLAYSDLFASRIAPQYRACDELPINEAVEPLGRGTSALDDDRIPNYARLIDHVIQRCGWDADDFDACRVQMRYPPTPASLIIKFVPG